jgi:hypothetical protein
MVKVYIFPIVFAIFLIFTVTLASATVQVVYSAKYGVVENNGGITITSQEIDNYHVAGYTCLTANCTSIGNQIQGLTKSTNTNNVTLVFPTLNSTPHGYVLYFYKTGYIGWEQRNIKIWGNFSGQTFYAPSPIYLSKKLTGSAPIMNLSITEEIPTNRPIRVSTNISISSEVYSAIENNIRTGLIINETLQTKIGLDIKDSAGTLIYTNSTIRYIPYSKFIQVDFYLKDGLNNTGIYNIEVYTNITDPKIIQSTKEFAKASISIIDMNKTNYTYTLINNLKMTPAIARINDSINFSFSYYTGYIDNQNNYNPANTTLSIVFYREGIEINSSSVNLGSQGSYVFNKVFTIKGDYRVVITGTPNDSRGNESISSLQEISFKINEVLIDNPGTPTNPTNPDNPLPATYKNNRIKSETIQLTEFIQTQRPDNETNVIYLNENSKKIENRLPIINILLVLLILILIILIILINMRLKKK